MNLSLKPTQIPERDEAEFLALPEHIRIEIRQWVSWLDKVEQAKPRLPVVRHVSKSSGQNISSVYRKLALYQQYGWRGLINRAKHPSQPPKTSSLPFLSFLHSLWVANGRDYKTTHLQMLAIWKCKAPIPGYNYAPPKSSWNDCPDGWTYCNICYHIKTFIKNYPDLAGADSCSFTAAFMPEMSFDTFVNLADAIAAQGYDEATALKYAALIGDTPISDEAGNILVLDEKGQELARLAPLAKFQG